MAKGNFGERLHAERELREFSLTEITAGTRIGPRFLEALENEQWEKLPGGVFNRGFVRAIAHFLGLDEENLLAEYDLAHGEQKIQAPAPYENRLPSRPLWVSALSILVILALLSGVFYAGRYGWRLFHSYRAKKYSSAAQSVTVSAAAPTLIPAAQTQAASDHPPSVNSSISPSPVSALTLTVSTSAATRVRILADNKVLLDAEIQAGENRRFLANDQFEVTAADSSAVLLDLNGRTMRPLGMPGASGTLVLS